MAENNLIVNYSDAPSRAILCAVYKQGEDKECMSSLNELERLLETAGGENVGVMTQARPTPDGRTVFGQGKIAELSAMCSAVKADLVVFDCELTPMQIREIENSLTDDVSVIDRTILILDIFAAHARTSEGRLQVELAQLRYTAPRLTGHGKDLSRQGGSAAGSIGSRGPGETKLEIDRRRIKAKISQLESELEKVENNRLTMRASRDKSGIAKVGIVGYTNAGKSTLLNYLTGAGILAEDKLFATLDPTTRQFVTPNGTKLLLTDTVGFIKNLPHHLVKAFKSTLDEAVYSDILMIVIDASDEEFISQAKVTTELLEELGASGKPTVYVFNKCDICSDKTALIEMRQLASKDSSEVVFISAKTGAGCSQLVELLENMANNGKRHVKLFIPPEEGAVTGLIYKDGDDVYVDYREDGIYVECVADEKLYGRVKKYLIDKPIEDKEEEY